MRKNLWIKIGAVAMSAVLLATTFTHVLPAKASGTTVEKTIDFETGATESLTVINGNDQFIEVSSLVVGTNETTALNLNQTNDQHTTAYYEPKVADLGEEAEYALPSNVQFKFKAFQENNANIDPSSVLHFAPILRAGYGNHVGNLPKIGVSYGNFYSWRKVERINVKSIQGNGMLVNAGGASTQEIDVPCQLATSIEDATWYTANCAYDWSDYLTNHKVTCTFTIANASGAFITYTETYTMNTDNFINAKAYGFGFMDSHDDRFSAKCYIDDIKVTLISEPQTKTETPEEPAPGDDMTKGNYIDFEDGTASELVMIDDYANEASFNNRIQSINNTKALFLNQNTAQWDTIYYQPDMEVFDEGTSCVRPSNVEFRFKAYAPDGNDNNMFYFYPLVNEAYRNYGYNHMGNWPNVQAYYYNWTSHDPRRCESIVLSTENTTHERVKLTDKEDNEAKFDKVTATSVSEATWFTYKCAYDWSQFTTNKIVKCTIIISKGTISSEPYELTLTVTDEGFATQTLYGFAFRGGKLSDFCIDNIAITLQSIDSEGQYTIHVPDVAVVPAAKGATISTTNQTIKMGFSFTEASEAIAIRGETVQKYGAVLVAGTQTLDTMKTEAAKFMDDVDNNENASYVCTARTDSTLPDIYSVTITNSNTDTDGTTDNRGKRATAIAYVVTNQGVYYSDAIINHSVMSVVKAIFNDTYLTDADNVSNGTLVSGSALATALASCGADYAALTTALTAAPTNATQRDLLLNVHFALNKQ